MDYSRVVAEIDSEIKRLQQARKLLTGSDMRGHSFASGNRTSSRRARRLSAAARARISAAQKARWARVRAKQRS